MQSVEETVITELELLLEEVAPREAALASSFVRDRISYEKKSESERPFGIPGSGVALLLGPILLEFIGVIAREVLAAALKKGANAFVEKAWEYFSNWGRKSQPHRDKEDTINAIVKALCDAGCEQERAIRAAHLAWDRGLDVGKKLVEVP
jgi:hypothetical protein